MTTKSRSGFTLVEILVVITIIGLLVAIALPALATARENARKLNCQNNLRELGKAVHMYEQDKEKYPSSFAQRNYIDTGTGNTETFFWTWVPQLFQYMDQQKLLDELYDNADPQTGGVAPISGIDVDSPLYLRNLPGLVCTSDTTVVRGSADISYVANMGQQDNIARQLPNNYDDAVNGVFHDRVPTGITGVGAEINKDDVKDGTAYTILITENLNAFQWYRWWAPGTAAESATFDNFSELYTGVIWLPNRPQNAAGDDVGINVDLDPALLEIVHARPSSRHYGGVNVLFADGGVRFIDEEITYHTYRQLMAIDDANAQHHDGGGLGDPLISLNEITAGIFQPFDPVDLER